MFAFFGERLCWGERAEDPKLANFSFSHSLPRKEVHTQPCYVLWAHLHFLIALAIRKMTIRKRKVCAPKAGPLAPINLAPKHLVA